MSDTEKHIRKNKWAESDSALTKCQGQCQQHATMLEPNAHSMSAAESPHTSCFLHIWENLQKVLEHCCGTQCSLIPNFCYIVSVRNNTSRWSLYHLNSWKVGLAMWTEGLVIPDSLKCGESNSQEAHIHQSVSWGWQVCPALAEWLDSPVVAGNTKPMYHDQMAAPFRDGRITVWQEQYPSIWQKQNKTKNNVRHQRNSSSW